MLLLRVAPGGFAGIDGVGGDDFSGVGVDDGDGLFAGDEDADSSR